MTPERSSKALKLSTVGPEYQPFRPVGEGRTGVVTGGVLSSVGSALMFVRVENVDLRDFEIVHRRAAGVSRPRNGRHCSLEITTRRRAIEEDREHVVCGLFNCKILTRFFIRISRTSGSYFLMA